MNDQSRVSTATRRRGRVAAVALALLLAGPLAACGTEADVAPTGAEQVPALATQLDRIDTALAARRFPRARTLLEQLTRQVVTARGAGDLDPATADRVLAAAARLLAALPAPRPTTSPTTAPPPRPPADDDDRDDDKDDDKDDRDEDRAKKKAEEARKKAEEAREKRQAEREDD